MPPNFWTIAYIVVSILGMQRYHFFRSDPIQKILSIGQFLSELSYFIIIFYFFKSM